MDKSVPKKWMTEPDVIENYLFWALKAGYKLTELQYRKWLRWNLQQEDFNMHPTKFISDITKLSYEEVSKRLHHYDDLQNKKQRALDEI